jgi:hypothetical protein
MEIPCFASRRKMIYVAAARVGGKNEKARDGHAVAGFLREDSLL